MIFLEKHRETIIAPVHLSVLLLLMDYNQICMSTKLGFSLRRFSIVADYRGITWMFSPSGRDSKIIQGGGNAKKTVTSSLTSFSCQ